ncbi:MAG: NAD(P)H-dependent oxidoreductase [Saprospiraceae bacterium]|nr:NAD(P)H-dependent oxidoreductase [Saprospiraceae bacterium]MCF8252363.1 NAD(P)H-dependent oxidoreductase [Saprospiraceae bacterium]MCF8282204.1 NAD(P)H-dependent oxidoreductase [Bacteroidales bacterium]MCF8311845.1 NAD(P)H-dependent oxidoreductase [Saprospiraceae bacterium]MCF8442689.1 NAD(P)H-dependent oxidoreductase [Saprospiraceae bacterium]
MITVISGTNRLNSEALHFAKHYTNLLTAKAPEPVKLLALENIPHDWFHPDMYEKEQQSPSLAALQDEFILPASKFIYVIPEYNGGFPGVLKLFLDACSIRDYKASFFGKKAAIVGVASGRAGNLRGIEHLTGILHHVGTVVMPQVLPISSIEKVLDADGNITANGTLIAIERQVDAFLTF